MTMNCSDFLFPQDLRLTETPIKNVLIIGSCLADSLKTFFAWQNPNINFDYILFNNAYELPKTPPKDVLAYNFQYLQIPLRSVISERIIRYGEIRGDIYDAIREAAFNALDTLLSVGLTYAKEHGLMTIVSNFIVPQRDIATTFANPRENFDACELIRDLNRHLKQVCATVSNTFVADTDGIASSFGKSRFLDDWWHTYTHSSAMPANWSEGTDAPFFLNAQIPRADSNHMIEEHEFYAILWRQIDAIYRCSHQIDQVKLVIFDLDNTIWRGQIAENYGEHDEWPLTDGWPEGLAEAIGHLRSRGILVAVCSRNDESLVNARWDRACPNGRLKLDDFIIRKINFRAKADNVEEIINEVRLTEKSVVFVDDNPVEREDVITRFPKIRLLGDNQFHTRRVLLWAPETQVAVLTDESLHRENMVRQQVIRESERKSVSREEFLAKLNCKVEVFYIESPEHPSFSRAIELLNKTNQFNTTGRRWSRAEIVDFLKTGLIFAYTVTDRFVEYGLVGVVLIENRTIVQYVLSCRVLGMDIEVSVLHWIISKIGKTGEIFKGKIVSTETNIVSKDIFSRAGFDNIDCGQYSFVLQSAPIIAGHLFIK